VNVILSQGAGRPRQKAVIASVVPLAAAWSRGSTALHAWEQGRRRPDRAARVLLAVIAKEPQAVLRAIASK